MFRRRVSEGTTEAAVPDGGQHAGPADSGRLAPGSAGRDSDARGRDSDARGRDSDARGRDPAAPSGPPPAGLDVSVPHPARVWNYWLGGRDYFAADPAAGQDLSREFPPGAATAPARPA